MSIFAVSSGSWPLFLTSILLRCLLRGEGIWLCRQRVVEVVQPEAQEEPLPPEANPTLFLSGLPLDITKREVAHILRPFEGFKVG